MKTMNYLLIVICLLFSLVSNSFACSDSYPCTNYSYNDSNPPCNLAQAKISCQLAQADGCKPIYVSAAFCEVREVSCGSLASDGSAIADVSFLLCGDTDGDWPCFGGANPVRFRARLYGSAAEAEPFSCPPDTSVNNSNSSGSSTCDLDNAESTKWISTPPNSGGGGTKTCSDSCLYIATGGCYTDGRCEYVLGNPITDSADFAACASYSSVTNNNNTIVNVDLSGVESRLDDLTNTAGQIGKTVNDSVTQLNSTAGKIGKSLNDFMNPDTSALPDKSAQLQTDVSTSLSTSSSSQSELDSSLSQLNGDEKFSQSDLFKKFSNQLIEPFSHFNSLVCPLKEVYSVEVPFFGESLTLKFDLSVLCLWFSIIRIFILIGFFFKALRIAFL